MFETPMDKYEYLIDIGKQLPVLDANYKTEENLVKGCQSKVWLHADYTNGEVIFTADSDAIITKGLVAMVVRVLSHHSPADIAEADLYFVDRIGLREHLSLTRSNGLLSMIKQMKLYALALKTKG